MSVMKRSPEIVLCTMGTHGDILPFLALAAELLRRGRRVTILSNENWGAAVRKVGAEFVEVAPADPTQSGRDDYAFFVNNAMPAHLRTFEYTHARVSSGGLPLLVYQPFMLGAECAALKLQLPNVKMPLQPLMIKSAERPAWPLSGLCEAPLGLLSKKTIIPLICALSEMLGNTRRFRRKSNAFRASLGLAPAGWPRRSVRVENMTLLMCPGWFAMPQADWPPGTHCVGFPYFKENKADPEIEAFMEANGTPFVFTPGTGIEDVAEFFARAEVLCRILDCPAVFLSPTAPRCNGRGNARIISRPFASLEWLLPRARLIVHHGGIGTTAQAIRAGIPQIVFPGRFDQPDNAMRIAQLRLGAAVMSKHITPTAWATLVRAVLSDAGISSQLRKAARSVNAQNAIAQAADHLDRFVAQLLTSGVDRCTLDVPNGDAQGLSMEGA